MLSHRDINKFYCIKCGRTGSSIGKNWHKNMTYFGFIVLVDQTATQLEAVFEIGFRGDCRGFICRDSDFLNPSRSNFDPNFLVFPSFASCINYQSFLRFSKVFPIWLSPRWGKQGKLQKQIKTWEKLTENQENHVLVCPSSLERYP